MIGFVKSQYNFQLTSINISPRIVDICFSDANSYLYIMAGVEIIYDAETQKFYSGESHNFRETKPILISLDSPPSVMTPTIISL